MCGRYYVDDKIERKIIKLTRDAELSRKLTKLKGDVRPSEEALVLLMEQGRWFPIIMRWGFPGKENRGLVINARTETIMDKPMFQTSIRQCRCVIPAGGFYEWNERKEKYTFFAPADRGIYMAGCWREYEDGKHFVILTTGANASVKTIHERMPLILREEQLDVWFHSWEAVPQILSGTPGPLEQKTEYAQITLDFLKDL